MTKDDLSAIIRIFPVELKDVCDSLIALSMKWLIYIYICILYIVYIYRLYNRSVSEASA